MASICQNTQSAPYKVTNGATNGYQQNGELSFKIPEKTTEWKINVTFSNNITKMVVYNGIDENCVGNICSFKSLNWNGPQEKSAKISLKYQISFEAESTTDVIGIIFNEYDICSSKDIETGTTTPSTIGMSTVKESE